MVKLKHLSGDGFEHFNEDGKFEVKSKGNEIKEFNKLSEAKKYYDSLNEEKAIWDITLIPELIDCQVYWNSYSYLIRDTRSNIYKIGKSDNPKRRYDVLKTANPFIELIGVNQINEKDLHKKYSKYRYTGEWFEFPDKIINEVLKLFKPIDFL